MIKYLKTTDGALGINQMKAIVAHILKIERKKNHKNKKVQQYITFLAAWRSACRTTSCCFTRHGFLLCRL